MLVVVLSLNGLGKVRLMLSIFMVVWYIPESELERLIKGFYAGVKRIAIYARVSGNTQKDDLERQISSLEDYVRRGSAYIDIGKPM